MSIIILVVFVLLFSFFLFNSRLKLKSQKAAICQEKIRNIEEKKYGKLFVSKQYSDYNIVDLGSLSAYDFYHLIVETDFTEITEGSNQKDLCPVSLSCQKAEGFFLEIGFIKPDLYSLRISYRTAESKDFGEFRINDVTQTDLSSIIDRYYSSPTAEFKKTLEDKYLIEEM